MMNKKQILLLNIALILVLTLSPGNGKIAGDYLDKVIHFFIFLLLGYSICNNYQNQKALTEGLLWAILLGLATEVIQQVIPGRNMDIYDGIADTLGVVAGYYWFKIIKK